MLETLDSSRTIAFQEWRRIESNPDIKIGCSTEEVNAAHFKIKCMAELLVFVKHKSIVKKRYDQVLE